MSRLTIRPVEREDRVAWERLYRGYGDFYKVGMTHKTLQTVWGWLHDPKTVVEGLVAVRDDQLIGLANFRAMPSPLRGSTIGFLDDLYVDQQARGAKVGEKLLARLKQIAVERGWDKIRWITTDDNYRARSLYDRVAVKTKWNTYEMIP
ncbi:MAG: GNAT family N-acetyltransferase [Rhodospirillaceae bacterium]|nr:GNAT family N-acetyltransferase [Rhodospirillaceae bacterium]